ncbi:unnamed protein product [Lymnaea stagnalis]|uniref:Uncharacterized protein n=1 Tax=Lymnaea stagnalis TaxID=6523 RepID=A0AAV2ICY2_LYMST
MDPAHKQLIQDNFMDLLKEIKPQIRFVCRDLLNARIISEHMYEDIIEARRTQSDQTEALLDLIIRRGPNAFGSLYRSILAAELYGAADILEPEKGPHWAPPGAEAENTAVQQFATDDAQSKQGSEKEMHEIKLPDKWPGDSSLIDFQVENVSKTSKAFEEYKKSLTPLGKEYWYQMRNNPRGRALIINNIEFTRMYKRTGSEEDRQGLNKLFTKLEFIVNIQEDKTKDEILKILKRESEMDHSKFDCFILVILSHGCKGGVFGTDGYYETDKTPVNAIKIRDIKEMICSCTSLTNKPKLLFIQACQGLDGDMGKADDPNSHDGSVPELSFDSDVTETLTNLLKSNVEQDDGSREKTPSDADVFVAMATTPGKTAIRNKVTGTWFIQAVIYIFANYSHMYDLNKLMTLVNKLVCKAMTKEGKKQVAEVRNTLQKTFSFFPGLTQSSSL